MSLRVALVGNMNNSNFAALRHLRDLGVDAQLFMYSDETMHFFPQNDTWQWERWSPHVHVLDVSNGGLDSLLARRAPLARALDGFDAAMGCGIAPVLYQKLGRKLDLFVPYAEGVEFIVHYRWRWSRPASTAFLWARKWRMENAVRRGVKAIASANLHPYSQRTFDSLGVQPLYLPLLALYVEDAPAAQPWPAPLQPLVQRMRDASRVVFSHASHIWKNLPTPHFMGGMGKRNQWLIEGFARYVERTGDPDALLCLFDYGVDVPASKALVAALGIEPQVIWFPLMSRRDIFRLLPLVDIAGSEFAGMYWGGCGWEYLAHGVPMLHQLNDAERYRATNLGLPPFFNVHSADDIAQVLLDHDRPALQRTGQGGRKWFDAHHGRVLAVRYVELLTQLRER